MSKNNLSIALVITTYNRPDALDLVLRSVLNQSMMPCEVLVADDGSTAETQHIIQKYERDFLVPLIHCWQEDEGFRLSRCRNLAIARAQGKYIVMVDGDMVLHHHFIRDHYRIAQSGLFIQGRRVILTEKETRLALQEQRTKFDLFSSGVKNKANAICCNILSTLLSGLFSKHGYRAVRGCNMAFWRSDVIKVNGFNESFTGWGREDSEFVVRLLNLGVKRKDLRFGGVAYHLYHKENPSQNIAINDKLLEEAIRLQVTTCEQGISQHLT